MSKGSSKDAKESEISPPAKILSPKQPPSKVPRLSTCATQTPPRQLLKVPFSNLDEDDDESWTSARVTPKKSKGKSPGRRTGPSPAKSSKSSLLTEFDSSKGFCPLCQVPLACVKITKFAHTARCKVAEDSPGNLKSNYFLSLSLFNFAECEDRLDCVNTSWIHFQDNKHTLLAESRAHEEANSDVQIVPDDNLPGPSRRLETLLESTSEVSSPAKSPAKDNPFLSSDSEDDIFKEYETINNDKEEEVEDKAVENANDQDENHESEIDEEIVEPEEDIEAPEEDVDEPEQLIVEPDIGPGEGEKVPCIVGLCDKEKQSVTVTVNGEAVKVIK